VTNFELLCELGYINKVVKLDLD